LGHARSGKSLRLLHSSKTVSFAKISALAEATERFVSAAHYLIQKSLLIRKGIELHGLQFFNWSLKLDPDDILAAELGI